MTTRNDRANIDLVTRTRMDRVASYSGWKFDFRQEEADKCDNINQELEWLCGAKSQGEVMNLSKKKVGPGLFELYMSSREMGQYTIYKYKGLFTAKAVEEFVNGWYLKYS